MKFKKTVVLSLVLVSALFVGCNKSKDNNTTKNTENTKTEEIKSISVEEFKESLGKDNIQFIDSRKDEEFNGFSDGKMKNSGHLEKAIQLSTENVEKVNSSKLVKYIEDKGISKDKEQIVYDTDVQRATKVADVLVKNGFKAKIFSDLVKYSEDSNAKLVKYPNYQMLVSPQWVKDVMDNKKPETYTNDKFTILEVSWGEVDKAKNYKEHIKGAIHFNTDLIEEEPVWNLRSPEQIEKALLENGITSDKTVIIYSDDASAGFRVYWALKWAGVKDIRYMNGGFKAWKNAGFEVETTVNKPTADSKFGVTIPQNPNVSIPLAKDMVEKIEKENYKLVSIRAWDEYIGKISGYDYIPEAGEPKGSYYGFAGTDAQNMDDYYDPDGTIRNPEEIYALWDTQGIKQNDKVAFYCGTGWRAGIPWFMTQMTGWKDTVIYDGGWNSWYMDKNLPVQKGDPQNRDKKPDAKNDFK